MNRLIAIIVKTASGVFLWVRLVVRELRRAARDGATFDELIDKALHIPCDLDSYFTQFIDSIPPEYRQEASILFQITLHTEESFISLHGLRLLDLSYIGDFQGDTETHIEFKLTGFDPNDIAELDLRLDATARRINSRCRGLIECYYSAGDTEDLIGYPELSLSSQIDDFGLESSPSHTDSSLGLLRRCNRYANLMHRSLRDFLIQPNILEKLQNYSGGPFNTRLFLCKARLAQILSLDHEGNETHAQMALGLSSYILSAISTVDLKESEESALIAAHLKPIVEWLGRARIHRSTKQPWYLSASFRHCQAEAPDFLGVALDFDLSAYLKKELTAQAISAKNGLSVLNCILVGWMSVDSKYIFGNRFPNIDVLRMALDFGADPNEDFYRGSVWAQFLEHLNYLAARGPHPANAQKAHAEAIRALLEFGAAPELPSSWLSPGILIPRCETDIMPVATVLRSMLGLYTHARQEMQECINLAEEKLMQARLPR